MIERYGYYADLAMPWLDDQTYQAVARLAEQMICAGKLHNYDGTDISRDLVFVKQLDETQWPVLEKALMNCTVPACIILYILPPNSYLPIHRDVVEYPRRSSVISVPLLPIDEPYADTNWYASEHSAEAVATAKWTLYEPKLLNILGWHGGVRTGSQWRASIQFELAADYADVLDLIYNDRLFLHDTTCHFAQKF